ncbi:VapE domain-containing protein [Bacteroides ndongoniae]|uniref:VapE domain-containing protein n=1 Tax=Bacteroides ndongoniae TaxID=1903262 RepID=UPI000A6CC663|nr:VapE domain-containing protein [Bacteroides ndongoniae]
MNLITNLKNWFLPWNNAHKSPTTGTPAASPAAPYEQLLTDLQHVCHRLPEGEIFVVMGGGEFSVRMTWTPDDRAKGEQKRMFSLNGGNEIIEWVDAQPEETAEARILTMEQPPVIEKDTVKDALKNTPKEDVAPTEESPAQPEKPSRQQQMMQRLTRYLKLHYAFRYNLLTERTECARINTDLTNDPHHLSYIPVDNRTLNGIALDAIDNGVDCWDRDIKRYVESDHVQAYHPFDLYFKQLPTWDGTDRVTDLAKRVSDTELWTRAFHRWMLAVTAQWTGRGGEGRRANSVAPLLVSTAQGLGKSTFCRLLLPPQLRDYFTESFDLTNATAAENKLASYGLINLDEFDRLPASRMPQLKNLMQMEALRVRRAYRRTAEPLPRIASFIGTSNRRDLLTDLSGSRRFICVEVERPIDCTTPIDYEQLYAQLLHELENGERCWFSKEEETEIQQANRPFYRVTPAEELVSSCFRFAEPGEQGARLMSAAEIYATVKKKNPAALKDCSCTSFARLLAQLGRRVHTKYGNGYWVEPHPRPLSQGEGGGERE